MSAPHHEISVEELAHEIRALRRIVIALLVIALVFLTIFTLQSVFQIPRYAMLFEEMLGGTPLPQASVLTLRLGTSPLFAAAIGLIPIGALIWLWLERLRPATPLFVILCLCVLLVILQVWIRHSLELPLQQIITGLGGF